MVVDLLDALNPQQRQAVEAIAGPVLVLAGPGSGKTRVLTYRVAYLVRVCGVKPYHIMTVTFTNKAAREMRGRLGLLLGEELRHLTIGTFHATCARILRQEIERLGYASRAFVIFDEGDQLSLIRQALKDLDIDDERYPPRAMQSAISTCKSELITPESYRPATYWEEVLGRVYARYQELLAANNALDFDDLLMLTTRVLQNFPDVLKKYQRRYLYILVDEFQDTNMVQYELLKLLAGEQRNLFCVGDEDQSIYGWRGADYRNVLRFQEDYPDARLILLERNYRSTQTILEAAKGVIARNSRRRHKELFTERGQGPAITVFEAYNEQDEAQYVVDEIAGLVAQGKARPGDCAVMYRTNAQSRALEDAFVARHMPYRLVGATRFYERREVKDVLAYLRLIHNPHDAVSLARVVNVPPRGIGVKTVATLERWAGEMGISIYKALLALRETTGDSPSPPAPLPPRERGVFDARARRALVSFLTLLDELIALRDQLPLTELLDLTLVRSGYRDYIRDGTPEGEERWDNIQELRSVAQEYAGLTGGEALATFLEEVALVSDVDTFDESVDAPALLTLHMAKGLEFPVVFIVGLEEGVFPHSRSMDDPDQLAEERRLCYVGITRAKERLYLVRAYRRTLYGISQIGVPSRFLSDIPPKLLISTQEGLPQFRSAAEREVTWAPMSTPARPLAPQFRAGDQVRHPRFGEGIVLETKLTGDDEEVTVAFASQGIKRLLVSFAKLEKV
jgi:DNA helicase-2/ATP-dependent DNA helicase PcrA